MKKYLLLLFVVSCFAGATKAQNTRGTENGVKQPDIIVVPFTKEGDDIRKVIEDNPMVSLAISKVKEAFNDRGFITRDFIALLKSLKTTDVLTHGSQSDAKSKVVQNSKADIEVSTKIFVINHPEGASEVSLELQAAEVHTGSSLANVSYLSGKYITGDTIRLANRALGMIKDNFFDQLQNAFDQIVENGREITIQIVLGENCELDVYSEVGNNGNDLQIEMEDWLAANAYKGVYSVNSSDKILDISMQVPLFDQSTGNPYSPSRLRGTLQRFLKEILESTGHEPKARANIGQKLVIGID
ncbi:MAG: DUF6175 family protein [Mediterranea sp.]|jgi:hypothetical protein|nr:DUF6175 family protein [Mediterranea sp.]